MKGWKRPGGGEPQSRLFYQGRQLDTCPYLHVVVPLDILPDKDVYLMPFWDRNVVMWEVGPCSSLVWCLVLSVGGV